MVFIRCYMLLLTQCRKGEEGNGSKVREEEEIRIHKHETVGLFNVISCKSFTLSKAAKVCYY